ncbi:gene transfer agent family protein [Hansschlegelia beijingensis]|uniref:Gene transfer agent family protein n=1 Tax=Hansschlegelia beijingensis TaxID=1133344 RepID=A0A7W6GFC0_9HYPH|nr:gene transfer agent family protein [Hansschlegelia beijingensis]MBB3972782.1 hypothetical protein [Hansschlegelia beijingensis]
MARGETTFDWADGEYTFALPLGQVEELQEKVGCGPYSLLRRLQDGTWQQSDIRETLRLGLIGGGQVKPVEAMRLVRAYVDERPLLENVPAATAVILAALVTPENEPQPGGGEAEEATTESPSPTSEASPPPSV